MTAQPNRPMPAATDARPAVLLRGHAGASVEVDLDVQRSGATFHAALERVARVLADLSPVSHERWIIGWEHQGEDQIDGRTGQLRCMHRLHIDAVDVERATALLEKARYVVDVLDQYVISEEDRWTEEQWAEYDASVMEDDADYDDLAADDLVADDPVPAHPSTPPSYNSFVPCDAPMTPRYRKQAGETCGQRSYVITSHGADDDGEGILAWCAHHYAAVMAGHNPRVVADSRHLL